MFSPPIKNEQSIKFKKLGENNQINIKKERKNVNMKVVINEL